MRKMFSENQIATIAQNSVSGGTQLYKHHLTGVTLPGGPSSFDVISTISSEMEVKNGMLNTKSVFSNLISCTVGGYGALVYISQNGGTTCSATKLSGSTITSETITFGSSFKDTVTAL